MATNCEPPAKTNSDISEASSGDRPLPMATAPNTTPIGTMATNKGAADLSPAINSARFSDVDIAFSLSGGRITPGTPGWS